MLCLQEIAALILQKNEEERERAQGVYLDEKISFLLAFELLHWNVQGTVHVWQGYVIHLATNENPLSSCYIHMLCCECVLSVHFSPVVKWKVFFFCIVLNTAVHIILKRKKARLSSKCNNFIH